jgi:NTE family protein
LPPGFPATEIEGEHYWDGGLVSNTPLQWVLDSRPRCDTLAFQVDLWSARGELPRDLVESEVRQKEIRFSSRTRSATDQFRRGQKLRRAFARVYQDLPEELRALPEAQLLAAEADDKVYNIIQLIYRSQRYEGVAKDYEFSRRTMEEHWQAGYHDAVRTLRHPEVLERPTSLDGVLTFDLAVQGRE